MQHQLIAGRYQILRAIGRGGMGTVWLCRDEVLGREVAVKQIGALPGESATETKRAMREARSAAALNHPNAVAVYDVVNHDERPWLVMEYVEGQTLADEISGEGQLAPVRVADIGAQLALALARAHERRIVHRDIKPGNVLIDKAGRPKISDFGIARGHGDEQLTQTGFVTGTPGYLSPEVARGGDPGPASDVWALGATLYAAVEGQSPYESGGNPLALLRAIATERPRPMSRAGAIGPAIHAMMDEDPARRWDMLTSAQRLGRIAAGDVTAVIRQVDFGVTEVIAVPPVNPTQRLLAAPPVAAAPAAERPERDGPGDFDGGSHVPPQNDRRTGRRWLPLAFVTALVVVLGAAFILGQVGDQRGGSAVLGTTSAPTAAKTAPSGPSSASESSGTSSSAPSSGSRAAGPKADRALEDFVNSYYSDVTKQTDRTWDRLTPKMQDAAGGRTGYDGFWNTIDTVKVNQVQANASAKSAVASLTFTRKDGTTSTETYRFTFFSDGRDYRIDSDQNRG